MDSIEKYKDTIVINDWINIDDTIITIMNKIATNCIYDKDENIYAWYIDKNNNPVSLCFSYDFSINNPFEDEIDKRFIDNDTFINNIINYKYNLLLEDIGEIKDNTIHIIQLEDYLKNINFKKLDKTIQIEKINGIIRKYWPTINDNNYILKYKSILKSSLKKELNIQNIIKKQIKLVEDGYYKSNKGCDRFLFRFMKLDNNNDLNINIIKLFTDIQLSNKYPFSKLFLNSKEESYHKLNKDYLKIIDPNICSEWIIGSTFFMNNMLQYISHKNTFTIIIKINEYIYIRLLIDIIGYVSIIINNRVNHDITVEIFNEIEKESNLFIQEYINKYLSYSTEKLKKIDFKWDLIARNSLINKSIDFFNFTLKYNRTDIELNFEELKTLFKNLFVYTRIVEEDEETKAMILRYKIISNYDTLDIREELVMKLKNPYLDLDDDEIIKILGDTFTITREEIDQLLKDWQLNINKEVYFKKMIEPGTEIILTYNTEFILANVNNVKTIQEFNRVVYFIEFAIDFYKKYKNKKIDKKYNTYFSEVANFANQYDKINKIDEEELERNNIEDEFRSKPTGFIVKSISAVLSTAGLGILTYGIFI